MSCPTLQFDNSSNPHMADIGTEITLYIPSSWVAQTQCIYGHFHLRSSLIDLIILLVQIDSSHIHFGFESHYAVTHWIIRVLVNQANVEHQIPRQALIKANQPINYSSCGGWYGCRPQTISSLYVHFPCTHCWWIPLFAQNHYLLPYLIVWLNINQIVLLMFAGRYYTLGAVIWVAHKRQSCSDDKTFLAILKQWTSDTAVKQSLPVNQVWCQEYTYGP